MKWPSFEEFEGLRNRTKKGEDFWLIVFNFIHETDVKEITPKQRQALKQLCHGLSYRMQAKIGVVNRNG